MAFVRIALFMLLLPPLLQYSVSGHDHHSQRHSLETDKAALLQFKKSIVSDPNSMLSNWIQDNEVCNFTGVSCGRLHHRVVRLRLVSCELTGLLSPVISNLTRLRVLNLTDNHFFGVIPTEFSSLRHLRRIALDENNLHGTLPDSLAYLSQLIRINLRVNNLSGSLPASFFFNCTSLHNVDFSFNSFSGKIPEEIGRCSGLWAINLYNNNLVGELPLSLANISLYSIDVENNFLSGELPTNLVARLPYLVQLHLSENNMKSHDNNTNLEPFFNALSNCTELEELELAGMGLGGRIPGSIGRLASLKTLLLQENKIFGSVPADIGNLSGLSVLNLTWNSLNGTISSEISQLSNLEQLFLSNNMFASSIPAALGKVVHLGLLDLSHNQFSGEIPESIGNLVRLNYMFLNNNFLSGSIPRTLGKCTDLYKLDLSYNNLTGNIPPEITGIREIRIFLNLSHNQLNGPLPIELSKLENVQEIDVSWNNLSGTIFRQISSCIALRLIDLSHNYLQGHLPETLGDLKNLESFDVSRNHLSGTIPQGLEKLLTLKFLNLSFNNLDGPIPSGGVFSSFSYMSFAGNNLCSTVYGMRSCSSKRHWFHSRAFVIILVLVIFTFTSLVTILCYLFRRKRIPASSDDTEDPEEVRKASELMHNIPRITYRELSEATGGFDDQRLIGRGSYGRVYKAVLSDGTQVAVKVLQLQTGNSTKSFNRECQVLKRIRHRNLIRIITTCSLPDFKALVLPYMANGSLDSCLYPQQGSEEALDLTLIQRVNICSDIAEGMAYLHHHSPVKVIHCDLKPSNVLLNEDMTALVSDFGIARLIMIVGGTGVVEKMGYSTSNLLCGSIGYIAPEYGFGSNTSTKGDVYSFGVLVLEMVTQKRPTDDMFMSGLNLHRWVKSHYHGKLEKVIDPSFLRASRNQSPEVKKMWEVAIVEFVELGILCTQESPSSRSGCELSCAYFEESKFQLVGSWKNMESTSELSMRSMQTRKTKPRQSRSFGSTASDAKDTEYIQYLPLYKAVDAGDWEAAKKFLEEHSNALTASISADGDTALHIAVLAGHEEIVEELVERISTSDLASKNQSNATALNYACIGGITRIAELLVKKNPNLLRIPNQNDQIPVVVASLYGHKNMVRYLYNASPDEELSPERGKNGVMLLTTCIIDDLFDIALDLLQKYPQLALEQDTDNDTALGMLAQKPSAFPSGTLLPLWRHWIYASIRVPEPQFSRGKQSDIERPYGRSTHQRSIHRQVLHNMAVMVWRSLKVFVPAIRHMYFLKLRHCQAQDLLCCICQQISTLHKSEFETLGVYKAVFTAVKHGIVEFVVEMIKHYPDIIWCEDEYKRGIFLYATLQRQEKIFSLIYRMGAKKNSMATSWDKQLNNILHQAAFLAPPSQLDRVSGAALQMQKELQWYKEVESIVQPKYKEMQNMFHKTPQTLFSESHRKLVEEGEKWMKDTSESCTVVAALIATIMFAAAFTVPGGYNQDGLPHYLNRNSFMVYIVSDAMSLFASSSSLLIFLGVLTSRYREEDFLVSLPTKLIIGLSTLFFSIATMMITFGVTLVIMLRDRISWVSFPIILLASLPVTLFALQQFPILVEIFLSTYGPGIFDKPKKWKFF